jgi:hypothetical protein
MLNLIGKKAKLNTTPRVIVNVNAGQKLLFLPPIDSIYEIENTEGITIKLKNWFGGASYLNILKEYFFSVERFTILNN